MDFSQVNWSQLTSNWGGTFLFCLGIYVVTFVLRRSVEWKWPGVKGKHTFWEDVALPTLPAGLGVLAAAATSSYPYPSLVQGLWARVFFGGVCGFFSAWVYKVAKGVAKAVLAKQGVTVEATPESTSPEAP